MNIKINNKLALFLISSLPWFALHSSYNNNDDSKSDHDDNNEIKKESLFSKNLLKVQSNLNNSISNYKQFDMDSSNKEKEKYCKSTDIYDMTKAMDKPIDQLFPKIMKLLMSPKKLEEKVVVVQAFLDEAKDDVGKATRVVIENLEKMNGLAGKLQVENTQRDINKYKIEGNVKALYGAFRSDVQFQKGTSEAKSSKDEYTIENYKNQIDKLKENYDSKKKVIAKATESLYNASNKDIVKVEEYWDNSGIFTTDDSTQAYDVNDYLYIDRKNKKVKGYSIRITVNQQYRRLIKDTYKALKGAN